jgi:ABC-type lipoprotein export system ATPase subunit
VILYIILMIDSSFSGVRLIEVEKTYGEIDSERVVALNRVSLSFREGERISIEGKSGSGKSTLLNLLGGLDRPTSGRIEVGDRAIDRLKPDELARYRLEKVGMIFQSYNLIPSRTAIQNVELPLIVAGVCKNDRRERAVKALEKVGLGKRLNHRPAQLSGGESQRVAIARALVNDPRVVLADEPTGNLDSATARAVVDLLIEQVAASRACLIVVTHDRDLARRCAERLIRIDDGSIVEDYSI